MTCPTPDRGLRGTFTALLLGCLIPGTASAQAETPGARLPLPLEVAVAMQGHNGRSPIGFSPDGAWIAHTVQTAERVPRSSSYAYADTGFPFAEGNARMQATLSAVDGPEEVPLGGTDGSSWGAVWSPDGSLVAFYSDEGGQAGLWVWERATRTSRRISDAIVRPFFGLETPRWTADGERVLVKLLPRGTTLAEANALLPVSSAGPDSGDETENPDEPSVTVRRTAAAEAEWGAEADTGDPVGAADPLARRIAGFAADLAIVNVSTGDVERLVERTAVRMYALSPDDRYAAFTVFKGAEPNTQQSLFDLRLYDLRTGREDVLAEDIRLNYGVEWSWSPEGRRLAYTRTGQMGDGAFVVISIPEGDVRVLENDAPRFAPGEGEVPPIWSPDGDMLYGVAEGALWAVDPGTGGAEEVARIEGWTMRSLLTPDYGTAVAWSPPGSDELRVAVREVEGDRHGFYAVDPETGLARPVLREEKAYSHIFSQAASPRGLVAFVARDQQQPGEIWGFDVAGGQARQISRINADLARTALGEPRLLRWAGTKGEDLAGALLLPPGYEPGKPLPLVVFVYGGVLGSNSIRRFGLWGSGATFNMHVLATRGYAVLYPDAPLEPGRITEDLVTTILPGVDAAIAAGYADPDRLAVMGQSFGSLNTLQLITRTDRFAAAIITAAVLHPDLAADYLRSTGYYERGQGNMGGTLWEYPERYRDNSPLYDFPAIETPLLIAQGDRDGDLVPAEAIFTAFDRLGKSAEYRLYAGEGHVISGPANVIDLWERRLEFLARHLDLEVDSRGVVRIPSP